MRKIDSLDINRIRKRADIYTKTNFYFRRGQAIFNAAYDLFPKSTNKLRNTSVDCYYDDDLEGVFLNHLLGMEAE